MTDHAARGLQPQRATEKVLGVSPFPSGGLYRKQNTPPGHGEHLCTCCTLHPVTLNKTFAESCTMWGPITSVSHPPALVLAWEPGIWEERGLCTRTGKITVAFLNFLCLLLFLHSQLMKCLLPAPRQQRAVSNKAKDTRPSLGQARLKGTDTARGGEVHPWREEWMEKRGWEEEKGRIRTLFSGMLFDTLALHNKPLFTYFLKVYSIMIERWFLLTTWLCLSW